MNKGDRPRQASSKRGDTRRRGRLSRRAATAASLCCAAVTSLPLSRALTPPSPLIRCNLSAKALLHSAVAVQPQLSASVGGGWAQQWYSDQHINTLVNLINWLGKPQVCFYSDHHPRRRSEEATTARDGGGRAASSEAGP